MYPCLKWIFLLRSRSFRTLKMIRDSIGTGKAMVWRDQQFLDSVSGKRFFLLVIIQRRSGAKIVSYPYGMSGTVSTSLECRGHIQIREFATPLHRIASWLHRHNPVFCINCVTYTAVCTVCNQKDNTANQHLSGHTSPDMCGYFQSDMSAQTSSQNLLFSVCLLSMM